MANRTLIAAADGGLVLTVGTTNDEAALDGGNLPAGSADQAAGESLLAVDATTGAAKKLTGKVLAAAESDSLGGYLASFYAKLTDLTTLEPTLPSTPADPTIKFLDGNRAWNVPPYPAVPTSANPGQTIDGANHNGSGTAYMLANAAPALAATITPPSGKQTIAGALSVPGPSGVLPATASFATWPSTAARNNVTGALGFQFVLAGPVTVTSLGRLYVTGNVQNHLIKLWRTSDASLVLSGTVLAASASDGNGYKWVSISPQVVPAGTYAIVVDETSGGDTWRDTAAVALTPLFQNCVYVTVLTQGAYPTYFNTYTGYAMDTPAMQFTPGGNSILAAKGTTTDGSTNVLELVDSIGALVESVDTLGNRKVKSGAKVFPVADSATGLILANAAGTAQVTLNTLTGVLAVPAGITGNITGNAATITRMKVDLTGQSANSGPTVITGTTTAGFYRIEYFDYVDSGSGGGTHSLVFAWTDSAARTATGTGGVLGSTASTPVSGVQNVYIVGTGGLSYSTVFAGRTGTPTAAFRIRVTKEE